MRSLLTATLLVSAAAIGYEIVLMRVLSIVQWHHFAYMIISLALLGYGASGTFIALFRRWLEQRFELAFAASALAFGVAMVACFIVAQRVPFNALEIVWNPLQFAHLAVIYLVFFVPFFFAACCIGLAFTCRPMLIGRIYFFDLFGAGLGAMLIIAALFWLSIQNALILLAGLAVGASLLVGLTSRSRLTAVPLATLLALAIGVPQDWLGMRISPYKGLHQALQVVDARVLEVSSSPLGLLTVVDSPTVPFRHAPGLSFNTRFVPPEQLGVFTDGDDMSVITRVEDGVSELGYLGDATATLPFLLLERPRVLVLGAGSGYDVLLALYNGARRVDAVELNPEMTKLVRDTHADYAGRLYDRPDVEIHTAEARGYVARSDERYDLIHIGLLDSFAVSGSGVQALGESYLYTVEALEDYLRHLSPGGMLAVTRWLKLPPRDNLKLAATAIQALRHSGVVDPALRIAMIRSWNTCTLLVKNGPFTDADVATIREFARSRSFDTAYYPSMPAGEANRFNLLERPYLFDGIVALLGERAAEFTARYKFDIEPATDDRPYFFHFFKWRVLPEVMAIRHQGGAGLIEWGYLVLIATLVQAALVGAVLILLPLARTAHGRPRRTGWRTGGYFFVLGLAFLFIEMAFIQKFILFLSHPLYSVAVVLAGFLMFAGLGSAISERWTRWIESHRIRAVSAAAAGIGAIALFYVVLLPLLFQVLIGAPDPVRVAVSLALIAPLAFLMGIPFPVGLRRVADGAPEFVPWAWGLNGFASVVSASLATVLAIEFGFTVVILLAIALYAVAAKLFR